MSTRLTRRALVRAMGAATMAMPLRSSPARAQASPPAYSYPVGLPGRSLGDGLLVRHGYATENTWYNPGWLYP